MSEENREQAEKWDVSRVRLDFPILQQTVHGQPLIYFDNAATTQKPQCVLSSMSDYYQMENANVHRGVHSLSERATKSYEDARKVIGRFINAAHSDEIIFTKGATEAINLVAQTFGQSVLKQGDEVLISEMEHHSNIVPWQFACERAGAKLNVIPVTDEGELDLNKYAELLTSRTKIVALVHVSNAIGTINPISKMIEMAHAKNIPVLIDGAQAAAHLTIDVQKLNCDFYVFSAHKVYGPTGAGILYGRTEWLERLPPYQGGGDMITEVTFEKSQFNKHPHKFEAGTPNMAGVIGLAKAIEYLNKIGMATIAAHENVLLQHATELLSHISGLKIIGTASQKVGVISFTLEGIHPHDIGTVLDHDGIAIRAGHHCAMPLMTRFNVPGTARASFGMYNTIDEVNALEKSIHKLKKLFS